MIPFRLDGLERGLHILCIGAHCDDIEIGCGGTLLTLFRRYPIAGLRWVVFASNEARAVEARNSAAQFLQGIDHCEVEIKSYRDAFLNFSAYDIKSDFEAIKAGFSPDIVFTHYRHDRHQDHRLLSDLCWNTFRNHLILEYEIPKYDGDLAQPNLFVQLEPEVVERKISILLDAFPSQAGKHWFDRETFLSLMRLRGLESAAPQRYAEAFHLRKCVL